MVCGGVGWGGASECVAAAAMSAKACIRSSAGVIQPPRAPAKVKAQVTSRSWPSAAASRSTAAIRSVRGLCIHLHAGGGRAGQQGRSCAGWAEGARRQHLQLRCPS